MEGDSRNIGSWREMDTRSSAIKKQNKNGYPKYQKYKQQYFLKTR